MPVPRLNNTATQDAYADAVTVVFPYLRPSFSMNVTNAAVYYQVAVGYPAGGAISAPEWESGEHFIIPSFSSFRDPGAEGFPPGALFKGIRIRSAVAGVPARVTVA